MTVRIDPAWLSSERFAEYEQAASGDLDLASRLYEWNARVSAALFEIIHHFEVLLRNAIVHELDRAGQSPHLPPGSPWVQEAGKIEEVVGRLGRAGKPVSPGRIYAGLTFGVWQSMFGPKNEELWRHALQHVFRHSRADRAIIADYLESVRQIRNTIAHHGSLIELDTKVEARKIIRLSGWINKDAGEWMRSIERVSVISDERPVAPPRNTVVVPAAAAWDLYAAAKQNAYIFPAGRSIKVVDHLAFYVNQQIQAVVPKILHHFEAVDWNKANAARLAKSADPLDRTLSGVIYASRNHGWTSSIYQVFILSGIKDPETVKLSAPISHSRRGRGSAFTQGHRYLRLAELNSAKDTDDLA